MLEADIKTLLNPLVGNRVYWDMAPEGVALTDPAIILQRTGGRAWQYVEKNRVPDHKHARILVRILTNKGRIVVNNLARDVEDAFAMSSFVSEAFGAPIDNSDSALKLFETAQSFGIAYPDP